MEIYFNDDVPYMSSEHVDERLDFIHYGIKYRSGRYPYGSGENPYQHCGDFLSRVKQLRSEKIEFVDEDGTRYKGDTAIAKLMGMTPTQLKNQIGLAKDEDYILKTERARALKEDGLSTMEIGRQMGVNESTVRGWLKNKEAEVRARASRETADFLMDQVNKKKMIDIGSGVSESLGITDAKLEQAVELLKAQGYVVYGGRTPQVTNPGRLTTLKVLCAPGTEHKEIFVSGAVKSVQDYVSKDGGEHYDPRFTYPASMDSKRLQVRYAEEGGLERDGLIELRRGCADLNLGDARYSQVRILVDNNKYIKGMAVYADDLPPGVDVRFNTNKPKGTDKLKTLKDIHSGDNPFGSLIKDAQDGGQYWYDDPVTGERKLGLINKRSDEGDWGQWTKKISSQVLSKQKPALAKQQLGISIEQRKSEYKEIMKVTNATVRMKLLYDFAETCDSDAVYLKAAAFPRQKYHVILPIPNMSDKEVYAPNYSNGEKVALIRYPHGGTFEIPILTVNNKQKNAIKMMGVDAPDAVGINSKVASRMSGADFDGDTVLVIPITNKVNITSTRELAGLKGFEPKIKYGTVEEDGNYYNAKGHKIKVMQNTQNEMGKVSNLINDMTLKGADSTELARAVRHSMVVIDAEKHKLDYKQSEIDNGIAELKKRYQSGGASTLISRAKNETSMPRTQGSPKVNIKGKKWYDPSRPEGALVYKLADDLYYPVNSKDEKTGKRRLTTLDGKRVLYDPKDPKDVAKYAPAKTVDPATGKLTLTPLTDEKTGKLYVTNEDGTIKYRVKMRQQKTTRMADTDDARTLISTENTLIERVYADYANKLKALANEARKEAMTTTPIKYDSAMAKKYASQVASIDTKYKEAIKNSPRERIANIMTNSIIESMKKDNPDLSKDEVKKLTQQTLNKCRDKVGAKRQAIEIDEKEWEAIQNGAISHSRLNAMLKYTDVDILRQYATPKQSNTLSKLVQNKIKNYHNLGYSTSEIAAFLGVSTSSVLKYTK